MMRLFRPAKYSMCRGVQSSVSTIHYEVSQETENKFLAAIKLSCDNINILGDAKAPDAGDFVLQQRRVSV
jgi:hypothetical protein